MCRPLASSSEQPCPMCRVFPHPRCPHLLDTCRNRKYHPAFDVQYLTNAEVDWFNGCGFCKYARTDPSAKSSSNLGWPGCCRPPIQSEYAAIPPYVWRAVNIVYHVQIPLEVKVLLDATKAVTPTGSMRGLRKMAPERKGSPTSKSSALPGKPRSGSSPQQPPASLSRTSSGSTPPASNGTASRAKLPDFEPPRRSASVRQPVPAVPPASWPAPIRRAAPAATTLAIQPRAVPRERPLLSRAKELSSASSGSGSSDGTESLSDSTVVSDGAFTDYLSDESEAELQRQAEARAALLAQTQMEEMEFKAARLQLAHVDLRPPKTWNAAQGRVGK
ncbi:hypothetical protein APHAL10511_001774 [Amanita phalloides]|nr:hypothetical protein APHAL10511_001774 [Amanita phalloides]